MESASVREHALRAVVRALTLGEDSPAENVSRSRVDQIDSGFELPCFDVRPGVEKEALGEDDNESSMRVLEVKVAAIVDGTDCGDEALDPLYVYAQQALLTDTTLDGRVLDVEWISAEPVFRPEGRDIIGLEMIFEVKFSIRRGNPAQRS